MKQENFQFTVHCFNDKSKRRHFYSQAAAINYANDLSRKGYKVKIYPYTPPKRPVDYAAERLERDGRL